jgi:pyruvate dehydrogenase E2 component (dihydrolipoamide acetyltransferase)
MDAGSAKGETTVQEPTRAQRTVARRTAEARATVPDVELGAEVDMARCLALGDEIGCSVTAMLVRASALALVEVPRANGAYRDAKFELYSRVNVGVAIDTEDSYVVPTVFDADGKPLRELAEEIRLLTHRARDGALTPPELSGATFTVWNLGTYGVASATAVITPPQAAAIAAGAVRAGPVVRDGAIVPGETMTVTLACDHRILYGAQAARFLVRIKEMLEEATL